MKIIQSGQSSIAISVKQNPPKEKPKKKKE